MAWQTPKTNWQAADVVSKDDFNRIEGNIQELQNTKETPAGAQAKAEAAAGAVRAELNAHKAESASDGVHRAGQPNGLATLDSGGNVPESQLGNLPIASTSKRGIVQLSNSTTSTSQTTAATSYALKQVRDLFNTRGYQLFTSNGTFTVPSGVTRVFLTGCGAGGAGGKGVISGSYPYVYIYGGGGGGGAASVIKHPVNVTPGQSISVTIGKGNGSRTTSFGSLLSISGGGSGGAGSASGNNGGAGGSSPSPVLRGTDGQAGGDRVRGSGGKSCFLGFGGGGRGGIVDFYGQETPPEDGEDGFLLVEW